MANERFFGRVVAPDANDRLYPMRLLLDPMREKFFPRGFPAGTYRHYPKGKILDQGPTGTCVAHGWTSKIAGAPIMQPTGLHPYALYRKIVLADEFSNNDKEANAPDSALQYGTSVRAGAKVLQEIGLITNYLWAESIEDVRGWHLSGQGGVVIGINWKTDMMDTDADGFINYTGNTEGGHCVTTVGWSDIVPRPSKGRGMKVPAVRIQQSWGKPWGHKGSGFCWLSSDDFSKAIADEGEVCAAVEVRIQKLAPTT